MPDTAAKKAERRAAAFWGVKRAVNNSSGRDDYDGSDSTHERLHIETKLRRAPLRRFWEAARAKAAKFGFKKTPILMYAQHHCPGFLICIHEDDFPVAVREWLAIQSRETLRAVSADVNALRKRRNGSKFL
jgi:hypothetical protein